ncbi:ribonuclease P [Candidatus Bathyarchaeota archaeon]|nr:MAG: ribonuclease P [Candidatus Bathyarchaeota archaeon]RLI29480.1 MAG: ribonuclease P [Candidatus Bathyarchaeota archaeon]
MDSSRELLEMDKETRKIALGRVQRLFELAKENMRVDPHLAQRYAAIARRIAMAARIRLPRSYRRMICRHCKSFIFPGVNCRVRLQPRREPHVVITCLECGGHMRIPIKRRKREKLK